MGLLFCFLQCDGQGGESEKFPFVAAIIENHAGGEVLFLEITTKPGEVINFTTFLNFVEFSS